MYSKSSQNVCQNIKHIPTILHNLNFSFRDGNGSGSTDLSSGITSEILKYKYNFQFTEGWIPEFSVYMYYPAAVKDKHTNSKLRNATPWDPLGPPKSMKLD